MARTIENFKLMYHKLLYEFLNESGIHGLKIYLTTSPVRCAKHIWSIFLAGVIIVTHIIIFNLILEFMGQPTEVTIPPRQDHVANSPFPGVAMCSSNKISARKMMRYAEKVYEAQQAFQPNLIAKNPLEMSEQLRLLTGYFPNLLGKKFSDSDRHIEQLHDILTSMYNTSNYSLRKILFQLAPDCEDFVLRGAVFGKQIVVTKYIEKRTTSEGACCLFNYQRDSYRDLTNELEQVKFESNSLLNTVQFVLKTNLSDVWHIDSVSLAADLHFFPREDYPAITTTTMGQIKVNLNGVLEVQVQPTLYGASLAIRNYLPELRQCYFMDEGEKLLKLRYYSLDECLLVCRMRSMNHYCGCVQPLLRPEIINATECTLMQLPCITQWDALFNRQTYFDYIVHSSSIFATCQCLPSCTGVDYEIYNNFYYLGAHTNSAYEYGLLKGLSRLEPISLVKFYFKTHLAEMTETDIVGDWVMLLSRFGGILSLFYGFSIISYIEILYYITAKWFVLLKRACHSHDIVKVQQHHEVDIYWSELQPKAIKRQKIQPYIY